MQPLASRRSAAPARKPSKQDPSRPRGDGYAYKKDFYRSAAVAADYDFHRFGSRARRRRDARKWRAILAALEQADGVRSMLDLPCGTGRFSGRLADEGHDVLACDISLEMMRVARGKQTEGVAAVDFVQTDAETLPFKDGSIDCVMSIRFLFHVDPGTRVRILGEMARVTRRWLILDYRHRYSLRYFRWRVLRALGLTRRPLERVSRRQLELELEAAGVAIRDIVPVARLFSDKWIVLGEARVVGR